MWCTNAEQIAVWKKLEDGTYIYEHCEEVNNERVQVQSLGQA